MKAKRELYSALYECWWYARKEAEIHLSEIGGKPLGGWSQEKHDLYHEERARKAEDAVEWLQLQMLRINPD